MDPTSPLRTDDDVSTKPTRVRPLLLHGDSNTVPSIHVNVSVGCPSASLDS